MIDSTIEPRSDDENGSRARAGGRGWRFWLVVSAFWIFFGFVVGNHVFFSMRGHGHDWGLIILWQIGGAAAWILLTPAVLALDRRFPLVGGHLMRGVTLHVAAALMFAAVRLVPLTALSMLLDPFRPVAREATFVGEFTQLLAEWLLIDLMVYVAILVFARVLDYREQSYRDQLRASRLRAELAAAELRALELEVQPHFLFNALNAIVVLVRGGEADRAADMVVALADLLRLTLKRRGRVFLPLREELEHVARYLDLQKARFGDRLDVDVSIDSSARDAEVPGLILQPLVENAFRHGIERKRGPGTVSIDVTRADETLALRVTDNGPGIAPDRTPGNRTPGNRGPGSQAGASRDAAGTGIGLANLRARLEALYDDGWQLELGAHARGGARVTVTIPWREVSS